MQNSECQLAVIPGSNACERLLVGLLCNRSGESQITLRQQSWAEGIGWYDQKTLSLAPAQLRHLKTVLGCRGFSQGMADPGVASILPFSGAACTESA